MARSREIPTYQAPAPDISPDRTYAPLEAFAAPGRAMAALGGAIARIGEDVTQLAARRAEQYGLDHAADGTIFAQETVQNAIEEARQTGNYKGLATRVAQALDTDIRQRVDNAPDGTVGARLNRRLAMVRQSMMARAATFEHGMEVQDERSRTVTQLEGFAKGAYRDPTLLEENIAAGWALIDAQAAKGNYNPSEREKLREDYAKTLVFGAAGQMADRDPYGTKRRFEAKEFDQYLDVPSLERLRARIDSAVTRADAEASKARVRATADEKWSGTGGAPGGITSAGGPLDFAAIRQYAVDAGFEGEAADTIAAISLAESSGNPNAIGDRDLGGSYGLTQIHEPAHGPKAREALGNPKRALELAWDISKGGTDFRPWTMYKNRGYLKYMPKDGSPKADRPSPDAGAAPSLDRLIAETQGDVDAGRLTPEEGDGVIRDLTRRHHRWSQAIAQQRAALNRQVKDGIAALADGQDWTAPESEIRSLLPAEKAADTLRAISEAREQGQAVTAVRWASPEEIAGQAARIAEGLRDPRDYARKAAYRDRWRAAVERRQKKLLEDPAGYVAASEPVQTAAAAIDPDNPGPGAQALIDASLAEQERLGVPPELRRGLPKAQAGELVKRIVGADPATVDTGAELDRTAREYGPYWPRVFGDLVKAGLPPETQVLAAMDHPDQAAARGDFQRTLKLIAEKGGAERIRTGAEQAARDIEAMLPDRLAEFRATVRDPALYDQVRGAVKLLAFYYAFQGRGAGDALNAAYDGVIGRKYDFSGTIRAPKGTLDTVVRAGDAIVREILAEQLPDIGGNPDLTPEQRRDVYLSAIRRGEWRVNEDDTGLGRMARFRDGTMVPARRADGSRIEFAFADAERLGARQRPAAPAILPPMMGR